jgi:hypothetical protein
MEGNWVERESEYLLLFCFISSFMMATEDKITLCRRMDKNRLFRTNLQNIQIQADQNIAMK